MFTFRGHTTGWGLAAIQLEQLNPLHPQLVPRPMELLTDLEIARETTGKRRNRLFVYDGYLATLNEGTEAP